MVKITPAEFKVLSKYILEISGIVLESGKEYLIETRLNILLEELKYSSYSELYHNAKNDPKKDIEKKIVDAISTNETYFFRDTAPFELLQYKIMPDIIDKKLTLNRGKYPIAIRIWSAACSTGQELYSIAIVLKEMLRDLKLYNITLMGTDISNAAISQASYARYNKFEVTRGLSPLLLKKYFNQEGEYWRIKDEIRAMAAFKKMNLLEPFIGLGKFDIIFFRNVAIYFSPQERTKLYDKISKVVEPEGYLIIGATESLTNDTTLFTPKKYVKSIFYQLKR
ncbi:MAG: protein-glutamate O-methyltransferase CheR [Desulfobacterales bacterium]|nr:protein-glutamate O-methyltransferase CheR [Desulfobacterales bacterium]MBF0395890.1 protein-glutamate O-methyltransferase CheR [Desulfobacterales bacterium]